MSDSLNSATYFSPSVSRPPLYVFFFFFLFASLALVCQNCWQMHKNASCGIHLLSPLPFPPSARSWCALLVVSETTLTRINLHPSGSFQGACTRSFGHMPGHVTSEYLTYTMTRFLYILCALFFPVSGGCVLQTGTKERRASRSHTWPFSAYDAHWSDAKRGLKIRKKKKWIKLAVLMSAKGTLQLWKPPPPVEAPAQFHS